MFLLFPMVLMAGGGGDGSSPSWPPDFPPESERGNVPRATPASIPHINKRLSVYLYMPGG